MSTLVILVVVGLSIVAVTVAVVAEPDKPAMERLRNRRAARPVESPTATVDLYRPPRWWVRLRSMVLLVILTTAVGATVAAVVGVVLALIGLGVREAVS
ncbi:MAG: hypothetical protein ACRDJP_06300 [Actinomycetota bacterium]